MKKNLKKTKKSLREQQRAEANTLILRVAKNLFEELGYEKTTMRKIAELAGISPAAIIKYFDNKTALLAAALFDDIEDVQKKALRTAPQDESVQKQFLFIARKFFTYYAKRPVLSKMLVEHSLFIGGEWRNKFDDQSARLIFHIAQLIEKAKNQKRIKKDANSQLIASSFFFHYLAILIISVKEPAINPSSSIEMLEPFINQTISGELL